MATRKSSRTSKTDHVLSLLAGTGGDREPDAPAPHPTEEETAPAPARKRKPSAKKAVSRTSAQTAPESAPEPVPPVQAVPASRHMAPPILEVARLHNEALSETIRQALTDSLEEELARQAEQEPPAVPADLAAQPPEESADVPEESAKELPAEVPASEETPVPAEESPTDPAEEPAAVPEQIPAPAPESAPPEAPGSVSAAAQAPAPASPPAAAAPEETLPGQMLPDGSRYLNVMEILVEERLEKYVRLFGLCSCPRCLADVRALALSRLPAKYVVLPASAVRPMMSLYQAKFDAAVIAQVIQACKTVMESPRHAR